MLESLLIFVLVMVFIGTILNYFLLACILGYYLLKFLFIISLAFFRGGYLQVTQGDDAVRAYQKRLEQGKYF